jgi:hypothetical protein
MKQNAAGKQYIAEFGSAMIGYTIVLLGVVLVLNQTDVGWWRVPVALLPMLPLLFGLRAVMRFVTKLDELQQRIQLHAITFAAIMTGFITFGASMLEIADIPPLPLVWVFPIMIAIWGLALPYFSRRYR